MGETLTKKYNDRTAEGEEQDEMILVVHPPQIQFRVAHSKIRDSRGTHHCLWEKTTLSGSQLNYNKSNTNKLMIENGMSRSNCKKV